MSSYNQAKQNAYNEIMQKTSAQLPAVATSVQNTVSKNAYAQAKQSAYNEILNKMYTKGTAAPVDEKTTYGSYLRDYASKYGPKKINDLNEQLKAAQERYGNVRRSYGTESYNAQEETELKAQIDSYEDQIKAAEDELGQIESWLTAYDNQIEGGKAWEDAQRRGLDSFAWYDETKGEYDKAQSALDALYKQKGAMDSLLEGKAFFTSEYQQAVAAGDREKAVAMQKALTEVENQIEADPTNPYVSAGFDEQIEAAIRARDEAEKLYGYAQQYRYASTPTGTGSIALGKAMARQLDEQRTRELGEARAVAPYIDPLSAEYEDYDGVLEFDHSYMQPKDNWTEDELNTYYGLLSMSYGTGDTSSADEYARVLNDRKQAAANQEKALEIGENATSSFWAGAGHTVAAAGAGLLQGIEYLGDMRELSARGVITEKAFGLADYNAAVTGSISQHLNDTYGTLGDEAGILAGKGWGDAYNVAVSVGQSWAAMAITGGSSALVSTMFFGQAAKSTLDAQLAKGVDPYKAVTVATLSGVAEVLGEALPLENIRLLQSGVTKGYINDILRSAAIEGGEEVFTSFANFMVDRIANGSDSAYYIALEGYVSQGMNYQEAQKAATKDFLKGLTEDFIAGSISGAVGGGVLGPAARGVHNATTGFAGDAQGLIDVAASYEGTKAASLAGKYEAGLDAKRDKADEILNRKIEYFEKLAQTGAKKDRESAAKRVEELKAEAERRAQDRGQGKRDSTLSIRQANRLTKAISEAQNQRNSESIKASIAQELENRGVENFQELAEIIHKSGRGKGLSDSEIKTLQSYRPAWQMREAVMAVYPKGRLDESLVKNGPEWMQKAELLSGEDIAGHAAYDRPVMDIAKGAAQAAAEAEVAEGAGVEAYAKALGEFSSGAVRLYDGSTDPREYITNMDVAINAVAANVGSREAFDKSESAQALTEEQRDFAWEAGQKLRGDTSSASQSSAPSPKDIRANTDEYERIRNIPTTTPTPTTSTTTSTTNNISAQGEGKGKAGKQQGKKKGPGKKRGGKVSSEGVIVDGVRYKSTTLDRVKPEDLRVVRALAETFDVNVVFYESENIEGKYQGANGFYHKGTIYLDVHAGARDNTQKDAVLLTAAHELTHFIAENAEAEFKTLREFVVEYLLEHGQDFENMVQQKMKAYEGRNKLDYEGAVEEVVADACEMVLKDSKAVEIIRKEKPSLFKTIAEWLKQFAEDLRKAFEGVEARSREAKAMNDALEELTKLWDAAAVAAVRNENRSKGKSKASLRQFEDGRKFVEINIEQEQFDDLSIEKQQALAKKIIMSKFGQKVIGVTNKVFVNRTSAQEYGYPAKFITGDEIKEAKMRASTELDNLIEAGSNFRTKADGADGHVHASAVNGFSYFDTLFKFGNEYYLGVINILNNKKGALLKDVTKIRNVTKDIISSYGENPKSEFLSDTSMDSIRNKGENVNGKYSQRDSSEGLTKEEARAQAQAYTVLKAENAYYRERWEWWKNQTRKTKVATVRKADTDRYARYLVNLHDAKEADLDWVKERLKALGDYFVQQDKDSLDYDEMWEMAWEVATEIAENAEAYEDAAESFGVDAEDVKDSIRRAEIYMSPSDIKALPEGFRRRYRGKIHISSDAERGVDSYYKELNASYGETLFPGDIINPEDQMIMIGEAWDKVTAEPKVYNPNKYHMNESINNIALDILNVFYGETGSYEGEIRTTPPTFADKAEAKLEAVKAEDREKLAKLRADKNARIEEIRREEVEKRKEMRAKEKAAKWDKYEAVKAYYQKQIADSQTRRKENAAAKKYRDRVFERVDTLSRWLQVNSDKEHIPEGLKAPVIELLNSLDLSSKQQLKGKGQTKRDVKYTEALGKLKDILANQQRYINSGEGDGLDVYLDLPSGFDAEIAQHIDSVRGILKGTDIDLSSPVVYMTADQLKDLDFILGTLTHSIRQINRFITDSRYASVEEGARETREYLKSLGERKGGIKPFEAIDKYVEWGNALPYYAFKRFGHAGMERFMAIAQGWGKMAVNMERLKNYAESVYKGDEARKWENTVHSIELSSGRTVQMSEAQMMGVWCMARREQGLKHLLGGGMRLADIEIEGGKKISQTTAAQLTQDDLAKIGGMLSDRQIAVATKLQQFMNTVCSDWGNEVSMARHGYRAFTEQFYYPITTDPNNHPAVDPQVRENDIFRLLNLSFTKALTPNANNSVVIFSVFDVFAGHATDMAKFNALALPILDLIKWYNHKDKIYTDVPDSMGNTYTQIIAESVQQSVETAYGKNAQMYVVNFLKDLNGKREGGRGEGALRGIIANYKRAAVAANLRVAAQQPTSIVRAAYAIAPRYIARGAAMSGGIEEALKYSGLAKWKDMGFFDTNIARGMREQIKHTEGTMDKLVEKSMELAKLGDRAVWGALWNAAKLEVRETQKLKGEELMEATARRFEEIILSTQVMDSTISRSDLMRNQSIALAEITSFMSEPTVSANILMDAADNINSLRRTTGSASTAARMGSGQAVKAVTIFALNAAATAAVAAIVDALRDDDEYQEFGEKWTEHVFENFKQNINPAGIVPLIGDIVQIFTEGETPDSLIFAPFTQAKKAVDSATELWKLMLDPNAETDSSYTNWGRAYNIAQGISSMSGVPVAAGFRELKALWNISGGLITGKKLKFYDSGVKNSIKYGVKDGYIEEEEAVTLLVENGEASDEDAAYWMVQEWLHADDREEWTRYGELYAAMVKDDMQAFEEALDALAEHGIAGGTARSAVESEVKRFYQGADGQGQLMDKETSIKTLQKYGGMGELEARRKVEQWTLLITRGFAYEDIGEQFVRGNITERDAATLYKEYGMMTERDAKEKVQQLKLEKDHGIRYSYLGDAYIYGEITEKQAIEWQMKYGGLSREEAEAKITSWDMQREYGVETGSTTNGIKAYLVNGIISEETAYDWLIADGNSPEKAEDYVYQYLFTKETGYSFGDIGEAYADKVITFSEMVEWYKNGSIYTHGSEEVAEEYAEVEKWKATIPGAEAMNRDGLEKFEKYGKYMTRAGLDEADFAAAWAIYSEAEAQYDSQGNKVKEKAEVFFDDLYEFVMMGVYSRDEANAIARTMYKSNTVNRYKKW